MNHRTITLMRNEKFISGSAAIIKLEKQLADYASRTPENKDVLVFLMPDNIPVLEVRGGKANTVLTCEAENGRVIQMISVPHGHIFRAFIEARPMKGKAKTLTKFLTQ